MYRLNKTKQDPGRTLHLCGHHAVPVCMRAERPQAVLGQGCRGAVLNLGVGAKGQCFVGAQGQHRVEEGTDNEQCLILPRMALFALSGYGGGDSPVTSPRGKLSMNGVPQPASHGRCPCAKDDSPGCPWAGMAEKLASKRE